MHPAITDPHFKQIDPSSPTFVFVSSFVFVVISVFIFVLAFVSVFVFVSFCICIFEFPKQMCLSCEQIKRGFYSLSPYLMRCLFAFVIALWVLLTLVKCVFQLKFTFLVLKKNYSFNPGKYALSL